MGPFFFKLLEMALQQYKGTLLTTALLLKPQPHSFSMARNTFQTSSRLLSLPTPSHSIPQKQPACAHNYFYLLPKPQTIFCEAFNIHSRGKEVSLVQPPKPPYVHTTACAACNPAHSGRREVGYHSSKNLPVTPPYAIGFLLVGMQNHQTMLTL